MARSTAKSAALDLAGFDYRQAFSRNIGLVTDDEQARLRAATVAIPGMGGVGGIHLATLARMGIGGFRIADADHFELGNRNRQYGATQSTLDRVKTDVMAEIARDINPEVRLDVRNQYLDASTMEDFLRGADLAIDSLDAFALDARFALFRAARRLGIPVVSAGPIGFSASMLVVTKDSPTLDEYLAINPSMSAEQRFVAFMLGLTPRPYFLRYMQRGKIDLTQQRGPSMASAVTLCAGFAATEALKLILGRGVVHTLPGYHYYDPYLGVMKRGYMPYGNRNPIQRLKYWYVCKYMLGLK